MQENESFKAPATNIKVGIGKLLHFGLNCPLLGSFRRVITWIISPLGLKFKNPQRPAKNSPTKLEIGFFNFAKQFVAIFFANDRGTVTGPLSPKWDHEMSSKFYSSCRG